MGFNYLEESKRASFLDWIDNNMEKIKRYLILEEEDLLFNLYENPSLIE